MIENIKKFWLFGVIGIIFIYYIITAQNPAYAAGQLTLVTLLVLFLAKVVKTFLK